MVMVLVGPGLRGHREALEIPKHGIRVSLANFGEMIHRQAVERLGLARHRPENLDGCNILGLAQTYFLAQWIRSKAAARTYRFVNGPFPFVRVHSNPDSSPDCRPVRAKSTAG